MIGLRLTFTAGRYHATGWDHHVNEGVAEWPPAPWRILRALVAGSYRLTETEREGVEQLVERLTELPLYRLPQVAAGHLRHYMPTDKSSVKVLDAFVAIEGGARDPGSADVWWPTVTLEPAERALLERVCEQVAYLGRAESWVEVSVIDDDLGLEPDAAPLDASGVRGGEQVRLLAALPATQLAAWRTSATEGTPAGQRKTLELPASPWAALHADVARLQRQGWSQAPGSWWVDYRLRKQTRARPRTRAKPTPSIQGVLFALDSAVLPRIERTIIIAEQMRAALMWASGEHVHWQFTGKDEDGQPRADHCHAYYLPLESRSKHGFIDRVFVWTREGFEPEAWRAVEKLIREGRSLRGESDHRLHLVPIGWGTADQLRAMVGEEAGELLGPARTWVSSTPFILPRYTKLRQGVISDSVEDQVTDLCRALLDGVEPTRIVPYPGEKPSLFGWNRFVRTRKKDRSLGPPRPGFGLELTFDVDIDAPILLGYASHFGLGRFRAVKSRRPGCGEVDT